jgi:hypothetical protein
MTSSVSTTGKAEPFRFSHSALTTFTSCGKRYQLKYRVKAPETPAVWFLAGTAVHSLTEDFDKTGQVVSRRVVWDAVDGLVTKEETSSGVAFRDWQKGYWNRNKTGGVILSDTKDKVYAGYQAYVDWRMTTDIEVLSVEQKVGFETNDIRFVGFVDRVVELPDGRRAIVDIKTGKSIPKSDQQLGFYKATVAVEDGPLPTLGAYWLADTGALTPWQNLERWNRPIVEAMGLQLKRAVENKVFLPNLGDNCKTCPVRTSCYAYSSDTPDSRKHDPLNPNYEGE